ncbi:conserved hypothetical protein [Aspergillus fumigatus A1163]|uniref:Uncharacterized protein n=1 Tax=Aspergillus fumigatus (strain CBS 144.89 / FGSC A1163 / CEA10) TaxID=451804 RepID=B0XN35_ASPFC|nr:conserved hypothetical protein [Aspergillus fumigatus A1163]
MDWVIEEVTFKAETFLKKEMVIVLDGDVRRLLDWLHKNYFHKGFGLPWLPQVFGCNEEEKQTGDMGQVSCLEGPIL